MLPTRALLTTAVAALTLAACTSPNPDSSASATPSSTTTSATHSAPTAPAPSPTPTTDTQDVTTPPARPEALDGPASEENAKAVGRYYLSMFPYAVATGDLAAMDDLSAEGCRYCTHLRGIVTEIHDAGNHGTGGAYELGFTSGIRNDDGDFIVGIEYVETPSRTVAPDGSLVEDFPDTYSMKAVLRLHWSGSAWTVEAGKATEFDGKE